MAALAQFAAAKALLKIEEKGITAFLSSAPITKPPIPLPSVSTGNVITLNTIRSKTAGRLTENWRTIPHVFQAIEVDFTEIELVRVRHKQGFKVETGSSLTYLPFIARAVCIALQAFRLINARFENNALTLLKDINLGIAVALNHNGLVVPVVLRAPELQNTVVIVNEFGEVGLDHQLYANSNDAVIVLKNGCLCCTIQSDLVSTLNSLYHDRQAGRIPKFNNVVIEASGLSEPGPILQAFLSEPTLDGLYRAGRILTLVDAVNWEDTTTRHDDAVRQVALAEAFHGLCPCSG